MTQGAGHRAQGTGPNLPRRQRRQACLPERQRRQGFRGGFQWGF